ncbi:MAG: acetoacetate decarboxylase family protein [Myxococcota bacterium]
MEPPSGATSAPVYVIEGREVRFPVEVRHARSGAATWLVPSEPARRLLPCPDFDVAEVLPGRAILSIALIDYRDNDLGDYNEISIALFVRPRSQSAGIPYLGSVLDFFGQKLGTYIHRLPVNQSFTREAGFQIWGFPKTVDEIEFEEEDGRMACSWAQEGRRVLRLSLPRGGSRSMPEREMVTYTVIEGVPHATRFTTGAEGMGFQLGGARLELGDHPIADELRGLGLPRTALMSTWMEKMRGRFEPPQKL